MVIQLQFLMLLLITMESQLKLEMNKILENLMEFSCQEYKKDLIIEKYMKKLKKNY